MNSLDISKITIVGHSQGCLVGIDFASRYPDLIAKLVLVAGSYKMPVNQDLIDLAEAGDEKYGSALPGGKSSLTKSHPRI